MGHFGPIPGWTTGRFRPIPFRSDRFGLGSRPIFRGGSFRPNFGGLFILYSFLGNKKFFLLARLILSSYNK